MRKLISLCVSLLLIVSLSVPVFAVPQKSDSTVPFQTGEVGAQKVTELKVEVASSEITPRGLVNTYEISIPGDGRYHQIIDFTGEYTKDTTISVSGTWGPSYAKIVVLLQDLNDIAAMEAPVSCDSPHEFRLWASSTWALYVKSDHSVSGTLRVEVS